MTSSETVEIPREQQVNKKRVKSRPERSQSLRKGATKRIKKKRGARLDICNVDDPMSTVPVNQPKNKSAIDGSVGRMMDDRYLRLVTYNN